MGKAGAGRAGARAILVGARPRPGSRALAALALAGISAAFACGDDPPPTATVGLADPPSIAIAAPAEGACVAVGDAAGSAGSPLIVVATEGLLLRPPGTCGAFVQCGSLLLRARGVALTRTSASAFELDVAKLEEPLGPIEITVEVLNDAGAPLLDRSTPPRPLAASASFVLAERCGDGAGGSGGSGGLPNVGGGLVGGGPLVGGGLAVGGAPGVGGSLAVGGGPGVGGSLGGGGLGGGELGGGGLAVGGAGGEGLLGAP